MSFSRAGVNWLATLTTLILVAGGCNGMSNLADLTGADGGGTGSTMSDELLFKALSDQVDYEEGTESVTDDQPAFFGEPGEQYNGDALVEADFPDVEITSTDAAEGDSSGTRDEPMPVAVGTVVGRFQNDRPGFDSPRSPGIFRGAWLNEAGEQIGVVRGEYRPVRPEVLPDGVVGGGLFHGRLIDMEGRFRGLLRGRYGYAADAARGRFFGRWFDRDDQLVGVLKGHWADDSDSDAGAFAGPWAAFDPCAESEPLNEYPFEPGDFGGYDATDEDVAPFARGGLKPDGRSQRGDLDESDEGASDEFAVNEFGLEGDEVDAATAPTCVDPALPHGFLRGWHVRDEPTPENPEPTTGIFRGHWRAARSRAHGYLIGKWEDVPPMDGDGDGTVDHPGVHGVFYGKAVNAAGEFRAFLRGHYGRGPHGMGVFQGQYFDAAGEELGRLRGRWGDAPNRPGGPMVGVWHGLDLDGDGSTDEGGDGE